jgi:hypothetical protein
MTAVTPARIAELLELARKATPGPWEWGALYSEYQEWRTYRALEGDGGASDVIEWDDGGLSVRLRNAAYIAAFSPQVAQALLSSWLEQDAALSRCLDVLRLWNEDAVRGTQCACEWNSLVGEFTSCDGHIFIEQAITQARQALAACRETAGRL